MKKLLISLFLLSILLFTGIKAVNSYYTDKTKYTEINKYGICKQFKSKNNNTYFIPTKIKEEFNSFINNKPDGVDMKNCPVEGSLCGNKTYYTRVKPYSFKGSSCEIVTLKNIKCMGQEIQVSCQKYTTSSIEQCYRTYRTVTRITVTCPVGYIPYGYSQCKKSIGSRTKTYKRVFKKTSGGSISTHGCR